VAEASAAIEQARYEDALRILESDDIVKRLATNTVENGRRLYLRAWALWYGGVHERYGATVDRRRDCGAEARTLPRVVQSVRAIRRTADAGCSSGAIGAAGAISHGLQAMIAVG